MGVHRPTNPVTDTGTYMPRENGGFGYVHPKGIDVISFSPTSYTFLPSDLTGSVTVVRQGLHDDAVSCKYTTSVGTTGTVSWAAGDLAPKALALNLFNETLDWRQFTVTLSNAIGAELQDNIATVDVTPTYLTSQIYPVEVIEAMGLPNAELVSARETKVITEAMDLLNATLQSGSMTVDLRTYANAKPEAFDLPQATLMSAALDPAGAFRTVNMKPEAFDLPNATLLIGSLSVDLQQYTMKPEGFDLPNAQLISGSLA